MVHFVYLVALWKDFFFFFKKAKSIPPVNNMELKSYFMGVGFDLKIH